ncbi:MAG: hypothetical protein ACRDIF_01865 [Actinomycetota bacterium]
MKAGSRGGSETTRRSAELPAELGATQSRQQILAAEIAAMETRAAADGPDRTETLYEAQAVPETSKARR